MSPSQLAAYGIKPGEHGIREVTAKPVAGTLVAAGERMQPDDASGWNQDVEIIVKSRNGKGRTVIDWETVADQGYHECTAANYWLNPGAILWAQSNWVCGNAEYSNANNTLPFTFNNGEKLCNSWFGIPGYPCETVHS